MRTLSYHQKRPATFRINTNINSSPPHKTPRYYGRTGPASIRRGTNINSSPPHETPRYCGKRGPASIRRGTNINSSPPDETPRYCGKRAPPPRLAFIILLMVVPIPLGPPTPQPQARKHCTGVLRASRENNFQTNLRTICGNIFNQSCERQLSTKTNA